MAKSKSKTTAIPARTQRDINARKYRSRAEREARANRIVLMVAAVIFGIVAIILLGSFFIEGVITPNQPVLAVGNQTVSTRDFQRRVVFERWRVGTQLSQIYQAYGQQYADQLFGNTQSPYGQAYAQLSSPTQMGLTVLNDMQAELIVKQYADANNITLSDAEVNKKLFDFFGYQPNPQTETPTTAPSQTPTALVSATPTTSPTATVAPSITATFTTTPYPTGIPTATPGPTEQKQKYDENAKTYFERAATATGMTEAEIRQIFYYQALQEKVKEVLFGKAKDQVDQVKARHILVATEDQAKDIMTALQKGELFANLAKADSIDTQSGAAGGELGWAPKGQYVTEFEDAVWSDKAKTGDILGPIKTQFGYHIIQLEGRELRDQTEQQKTQGLDKQFQDWLTAQATEKKATKFDYWTDRVPNKPTLDELGLPSFTAQ